VSVAAVALVFAGGAVGAPTRYLADRAVTARRRGVFPLGTVAVNVVGSLVLGLLAGAARWAGLPEQVTLLAATGFCGALTTYSTFGYETVRLLEEGAPVAAAGNALASLALGLAAATGGVALAGVFWS
jgi:CrcB protein